MITIEQEIKLERMQKICLKIIYGFEKTYEELLAVSNIKSLKDRRIEAFKKFALTLSQNERYSDWFPVKNNVRTLRTTRFYQEHNTKTKRLFDSPLYAMRRLLNEERNTDKDDEDSV